MCVVSMVGDHYTEKWQPYVYPDISGITFTEVGPTRSEFDALKKEVEEMKALMVRAVAYDKANNQPKCETLEKIELLRKVAALVGVDLDEVFGG